MDLHLLVEFVYCYGEVDLVDGSVDLVITLFNVFTCFLKLSAVKWWLPYGNAL